MKRRVAVVLTAALLLSVCGNTAGRSGETQSDGFTVRARIPLALPGAQSLIGLLELPGIFGIPEQGGVMPAGNPQSLAVFAEPDEGAEPMARLSALDYFEYREYSYEAAAAVVYDRRPGWYAIGLHWQPLPRGWVRAAEVGTFYPIADLLQSHLAYLNEHWDGYLWSGPGEGLRMAQPSLLKSQRVPGAREEYAVNVISAHRIGVGLWLRVETLSADACRTGDVQVVDSGWIPAYAASGELVAGYYSRGC